MTGQTARANGATNGATTATSNTPGLPTHTKAAIVQNPGSSFTVALATDIPTPQPAPDEVLVRLSVTGICYSDLHYMLEDLGRYKMSDYGVRSPGHEGIGRIVALGSEDAKVNRGLKLGERVGIKPVWSTCNTCELCCDEREMYCRESLQTGMHVPGTYQQYVIGKTDHVIRIPEGVSDEVAAPIMCAGATIYRGITEAGLKPGHWVIFSGAGGGVGHLGVQYAKAMGMRVVAVDGGSDKEEMCKRIGADHFVDFMKVQDVPAEVVKLTNGGAHGLIVTASNSKAYARGLEMLRTSGVFMCIGIPSMNDVPSIADPLSLLGGNKRVTGTIVGTRSDARKALQFAAQGLVKPVITHYTWSELPEAVSKLLKGQVAGRCVVSFDK